uniref:Uncharacterized protein n=1 Tax=Oryza nivara TaxID=4536 RepID=A0A0E0G4Y6_ORYNI
MIRPLPPPTRRLHRCIHRGIEARVRGGDEGGETGWREQPPAREARWVRGSHHLHRSSRERERESEGTRGERESERDESERDESERVREGLDSARFFGRLIL